MGLFSKKTPPFFQAMMEEDGGLEVRINTDVINGPEEAGIMLADFANHFANALAYSGKASAPEEALHAILATFVMELENPTDTATGAMLGEEE